MDHVDGKSVVCTNLIDVLTATLVPTHLKEMEDNVCSFVFEKNTIRCRWEGMDDNFIFFPVISYLLLWE